MHLQLIIAKEIKVVVGTLDSVVVHIRDTAAEADREDDMVRTN